MTTAAQQNENHEQVNSLSEEQQIQTRTIINGLKQQRDTASNALVVLSGEKAVVEHRLALEKMEHARTKMALDKANASLSQALDEAIGLRMVQANINLQISELREVIESFYAKVGDVADIDELRAYMKFGEMLVTEPEAETEEKPQSFWQRFVAAFLPSSN